MGRQLTTKRSLPLEQHQVASLLLLLLVLAVPRASEAATSSSQDTTTKAFKLDVDEREPESGERVQLHSQGVLTQTVDLDLIPQVKRVACFGNQLLLAVTDSAVAHGWRKGQLVIGGPAWGCNATWLANGTLSPSQGVRIYVKIDKVVFPVEGRPEVSMVDMVTIHHVTAGPLDMLQEATIFFRYQPPSLTAPSSPPAQEERLAKSRSSRFRRSLYNLVSNLVGDVNWNATFSSVIPLNLGSDASGSPFETVAIHKAWGQPSVNVTRGRTEVASVDDDFVLLMDRLKGLNRLTYTFDLVIKSVNDSPHILRYISQFDVNSELSMDATVKISREIGLTYLNVPVWTSPLAELVRIPVAQPSGLPPIYLVISAESVIQASVQAYIAEANVIRTAFNTSGFITVSQQYDAAVVRTSDVTFRNWSAVSNDRILNATVTTHTDFNIKQTIKLNSAISWHYHDVDLDLAPPVVIALTTEVGIKPSTAGAAQCVDCTLSLDALVDQQESRITLQAFGLSLWNVTLQPAMSRSLHVLDNALGQECHAKCSGPSQLLMLNMSRTSQANVTRGDQAFGSLRALAGTSIAFLDTETEASWCGSPGLPCYKCTAHAYDKPTSQTCAARLMTPRLASAMSRLAELIDAEWPDRRLLVLEAWDEANSLLPGGAHNSTALYKEGRAGIIALTSRANATVTPLLLTTTEHDRFAQLAVCGGFELVQLAQTVVGGLEVAVQADGYHMSRAQLGEEEADVREEFRNLLNSTTTSARHAADVDSLAAQCAAVSSLTPGSAWPNVQGSPESVVGPTDTPLSRTNRAHSDRLLQYDTDGGSVTFSPEGRADSWCGLPTRPCSTCVTSLQGLEAWDWCSTRVMTPRLALRFRTLQRLAEKSNIGILVIQGFSEPTAENNSSVSIFNEGRALVMTTTPRGNETLLSRLAVCAGFDYVQHSVSGHVTVYVQSQVGYKAHSVYYLEGRSYLSVPISSLDTEAELTLPTADLALENDVPLLLDGGSLSDVMLSKHIKLRDVMSGDSRYFRFDELLLTCLELVFEDYGGRMEIIKNSAFRTRTTNFLSNLDAGPVQEQWRHQTGQAVRLRPLPNADAESLFAIAKSILRECPAMALSSQRAVGIGCHVDHVYLDIRPLEKGNELQYVEVWNSGTGYCKQVVFLQLSLLAGGPVVQSLASVTCRDRGLDPGLDPGLEFVSFQLGQQGFCLVPGQAEFCQISQVARVKAADDLQELLTSAAGHGRLPRFEIIPDIRACLVDNCGGCPGGGAIFDAKVRACARVVHKYLERAAAPLPDLHNVTTFFNTDTEESLVHGEACRTGRVCLEDTIIYSLLVPTMTRRFYPNPAYSVERELFAAAVNPIPLLDLAAQELAHRTSGVVAVYLQAEADVFLLRNVLKVLFAYNQRVTLVELHLAPGVDAELVTSSIQRKLTSWAGVACPRYSRFAMAPFTVITMDTARVRRSAHLSTNRNKVKAALYNWEMQWLSTFK